MRHCIYFFLLMMGMTSCFTPSKLVKISDLSSLNGRYYTKSEVVKEPYRTYQAHMMLLLNENEDISASHYADISFTEPNQLKISYPILQKDSIVMKTIHLEGKRKKKFLEYRFSNEHIFIPLIYERSNIDRIRIGSNAEGKLLIEKYRDTSGGIFILGGGFSSTKEFAFTRYNDYTDPKPFMNNEKKWGVMGANNQLIVEPKYELTNIFKEKYIIIKENGKVGLLAQDGTPMIAPQYDDIVDIDTQQSPVFYVQNNGRYGLVKADGTEIAPAIYDRISRFNDDYFELNLGDKQGLATAEQLLYPAIYDSLAEYPQEPTYKRYMDIANKYLLVKRNEEYYILDIDGYEYKAKPARDKENKLKAKDILFGNPFCCGVRYVPIIETKRKVSIDEQKP